MVRGSCERQLYIAGPFNESLMSHVMWFKLLIRDHILVLCRAFYLESFLKSFDSKFLLRDDIMLGFF